LLGSVPRRYGAIASLSDDNPEYVVGLRGLKARIWFVNSGNTNSPRDGKSWDGAFASLALLHSGGALAADDIVVVAPGHVETIVAASGVNMNVAGVTYLGYGTGNRRPQISIGALTSATLAISAAGVTVRNFRITGDLDAIVSPVIISAADCRLFDIVTQDVTGQAIDFIVTTAAANRLVISGWKHMGDSAAGADTAISVVGGDDWVIEDFELYGNFAVAGIENVTTASNRVRIGGGARPSYIWTEHANDICITVVSTTTGHIGPNINCMLQDNAANITECCAGAACQFFLPINVCNLAGEASMVINITASTDA
jgi:hypothetical protein